MNEKPTYEALEERVRALEAAEAERQQVVKEAASAKGFLDTVVDGSPFAMWIAGPDGTVIRTNRSLRETLNLADDDIVGKYNVLKDVNLEKRGIMSLVRSVFDGHEAVRFSIPWKASEAGEVDFQGGRDVYIDVSIFPILNSGGRLTHVVCQWVDITEQKKAEEALLKNEAFNRSIIQSSRDCIKTLDLDGNLTFMSKGGQGLLEIDDVESFLKTPWIDFWEGEDYRKAREAMAQAKAGEVGYFRGYCPTHKGNPKWWGVKISPIYDAQGNVERLLSVSRDITIQKRQEDKLRKIAEEAQLSRDTLETLVDTAPVGIVVADTDGSITFHNKGADDLVGGEISGNAGGPESGYQLLKLDGRPFPSQDLPLVRAIKQNEPVENVELIVRHEDGTDTIVLANGTPLRDAKGNVRGGIAIMQDITERKRVENELRESKAILQAAMDHSQAGMAIADAPDGKLRYVNESALRIRGRPREEIVEGIGIEQYVESWQILHLDGTPYDTEEVPLARAILYGETSTKEFIVRRPDQEDRIVWADAAPIYDPEGMISAGIVVFLDITERKAAEMALKESEEKFGKLFYSNPTWMAIMGLHDGVFLDVNSAFEQMSGFSRDEVIGQSALALGFWPEPEKREQFVDLAVENGRFQEQEVTFLTKDKKQLRVLWSAEVININNMECLLSTVMDISELKKSQEERDRLQKELNQAQKMEAIGTLSGGIAHDFNNVLSIILGNAELALSDIPERSPAHNNLKEVRKACDRAKEVIQQILSFSRKAESEMRSINVSPIIKESVKLLRASIPTSINIQEKISTDIKPVLGDPTQLHQVFLNLCTNAAHAMEEAGGILEIELSNEIVDERKVRYPSDLAPGQYLRLAVKDTGHGMTPDVMERIFDPYFTTKASGKGTGMGLAVVHGIVKSHNGAISVSSSHGEGSNFEILLPAVEKAEEETSKISLEIPTGNERILFVDDEAALARLNKERLEHLGYRVETRTNPLEALELFQSHPEKFDLVITDATMPHMTGDRLAREIMTIRSDIPILLCTGYSDRIDEENAEDMGIAGFAMKPLDMGELARKVRELLSNQAKG